MDGKTPVHQQNANFKRETLSQNKLPQTDRNKKNP